MDEYLPPQVKERVWKNLQTHIENEANQRPVAQVAGGGKPFPLEWCWHQSIWESSLGGLLMEQCIEENRPYPKNFAPFAGDDVHALIGSTPKMGVTFTGRAFATLVLTRINPYLAHRKGAVKNLFVTKPYSGLGYEILLLNALMKSAKSLGIFFLEIELMPEDIHSAEFYKSRGFVLQTSTNRMLPRNPEFNTYRCPLRKRL